MSLIEHAIYQRWSDNAARDATITIETGTPPDDLATYGPTALVDDNPARLARIEDTDGAWLLTFDDPVPIGAIALIHHNFETDADVRIQANIADDWSDPPIDVAITIPAWRGTGSRRWPLNPWCLVPTSVLIGDARVSMFPYWRLVVTGNANPLRLGQIWLSRVIRRFDPDVQWGVTRTFEHPIVANRTAYGVDNVYPRATNRWSQTGTLQSLSDETDAEYEAQWFDVQGRARPWLLVPDGLVNACYLVRWAMTTRAWQWIAPTVKSMPIGVEEVARGLRP